MKNLNILLYAFEAYYSENYLLFDLNRDQRILYFIYTLFYNKQD